MDKIEKFRKIWIFLLGFASILFVVIGLAKIIADKEYLEGTTKLVIAITLLIAAILIYSKKIILHYDSIGVTVFLNMGFIFLIIGGASINRAC